MTTTIKLRSPKDLGPAMRKLGKNMQDGVVAALRKTARWGASDAVRVSATSVPRPRALGTYERSFVVTKLVDGAALSNSARYARFVELGRAPGKQPPVQAILEWMIAKRIDKQMGRALGRDSAGKFQAASGKQIEAVARRIARAIGRRGTKGRFVFRRLIPRLQTRLQIEMSTAMRAAFEKSSR
jgi:hypothetical protein